MEQKLTAKEFIEMNSENDTLIDIEGVMIEFAKLHVEAALKSAAHEAGCYNKAKFPGDENWVVDMESVLHSYPLTNIK
jgi:hypothetical protein